MVAPTSWGSTLTSILSNGSAKPLSMMSPAAYYFKSASGSSPVCQLARYFSKR